MPVRGCNEARGWINIAGSRGLFTPYDVGLYEQILKDQAEALTAGATESVALYGDLNNQETRP